MVVLGAGATFGIGTAFGAAVGFTALSQVLSITGPEIGIAEVEITSLTSANYYREWVMGWGDAGEITLDTMFDKVQYQTILTLVTPINIANPTAKVFCIKTANNDQIQFNGFIKLLGQAIELDGPIKCPITLRTTGKPQYFAGP